MNDKLIIEILQRRCDSQEKQIGQQSEQWSAQVESLTKTVNTLNEMIASLKDTVRSLEKALLLKNGSLETLANEKRAIEKLAFKKSEKIKPAQQENTPALKSSPEPKERGNNNAGRKTYFNLEIKEDTIEPKDPDFQANMAKLLGTRDVIRYEFIQPRFIKHIYHTNRYLCNGLLYTAKVPAAPFFNSNYDASFIAGIIQLHYIYSLPIERIVKYFKENGFDLPKSTAHGFMAKAAVVLDGLAVAMKDAILEEKYLHMDESYCSILTRGKENKSGKQIHKGYIWAALAEASMLVYFFFENDGSRKKEVLTNFLPKEYKGAIHSDGLADYKIIESDEYPHAIRIGCFQHCKREFLDIYDTCPDAKDIVERMNSLYRVEHEIPPGWSPPEKLKYRKDKAGPIIDKLEKKLQSIKKKKDFLPKSILGRAVSYTLNQYDALKNYLLNPDYELDNNAIERIFRYISLYRKNSEFFGSSNGAARATVIYSLACSCRLNNINSFEYFKDILNHAENINPATDKDVLRQMLPDKWKSCKK
jgi:transposase